MDEQLQADMALMNDLVPETTAEEQAEEEDGLNYYVNLMAEERKTATTDQKMEFIRSLLTM